MAFLPPDPTLEPGVAYEPVDHALHRDAARYRFLRDHRPHLPETVVSALDEGGQALDEAVDEAIDKRDKRMAADFGNHGRSAGGAVFDTSPHPHPETPAE